jgi:hypothetical protein
MTMNDLFDKYVSECIPELQLRSQAWCKQRALEYIDKGEISEGIASMMSDMGKHPETAAPALNSLAVMMLATGQLDSIHEARKFINGYN